MYIDFKSGGGGGGKRPLLVKTVNTVVVDLPREPDRTGKRILNYFQG